MTLPSFAHCERGAIRCQYRWNSIMNLDPLEELLWGTTGAEKSLRNTGQFPTGWYDSYRDEITLAQTEFSGPTWPKKLFRLLHFSSTHLVLRYQVWRASNSGKASNAPKILSRIQFQTATFFWSSISDVPPNSAALSRHETGVVQLCFGPESPIRDPPEVNLM